VRKFSVEDAKKANLWGQNTWKNYPKRMLQMRARGFTLRDCFPDALRGLYLVEELQDMPPEKDITSAPGAGVVVEPAAPAPERLDLDKVLESVAAATSSEDLKSCWREWADKCQKENDLDKYQTIKQAVHEKALELKAAEPPPTPEQGAA